LTHSNIRITEFARIKFHRNLSKCSKIILERSFRPVRQVFPKMNHINQNKLVWQVFFNEVCLVVQMLLLADGHN